MITPNPALRTLFQQDQQERRNHPPYGTPEYWAMRQRDEQRRQRVQEIMAAGELSVPEDYYHAALVLQHGGNVEEVWQAYLLAKQSAELGYRPARWLTAAAYDRWLMYQGLPQKYATQIVPDGQRYRVWDVDPASTDSVRSEWDTRSLAEQQARAEELTQTDAQPPMERAPMWLKEAVKRWHSTTSADF